MEISCWRPRQKVQKQPSCPADTVPTLPVRIQSLRKGLKDFLEPNYGLLDHLLALGVLSRDEIASIRSKSSLQAENICLLDYLAEKDENQCENFLTALERSHQLHIVNYIRKNGVFDVDADDLRPLEKVHVEKINICWPQLVDLIDPNNGLLMELMNCQCISWRHREYIDIKPVPSERNQQLLEILLRRSVADFNNFVACLVKCDQQFAVKSLTSNGVLVSINVNLDKSSNAYDVQCENHLVYQFASLVYECSTNRRERTLHEIFLQSSENERLQLLTVIDSAAHIMQRLDCDIEMIRLTNHYHLVSYFFCRSYAALKRLRDMFNNGTLLLFLSDLFSLLWHRKVWIQSIGWDGSSYEKYVKYFKWIQDECSCRNVGQSSISKENNFIRLHADLQERIFTKAAVLLFETLRKEMTSADVEALNVLATTCRAWYKLFSTQRHEITVKLSRHFSDICHPFRRQLKPVSIVPGATDKPRRCCIAHCGSVLYVVPYKSRTVCIYDDSRLMKSTIKLPDIKVTSVAACGASNRLFLTCKSSHWIWQMALTLSEKAEKCISTKRTISMSYPQSLSVRFGRLLITKRDGVILFDSRSRLLIANVTTQGSLRLRHAVETSQGTFMVCATSGQFSERVRALVGEIDNCGQLLRYFPCGTERDPPSYVEILSNDGLCLVVCPNLNGVVMLNRHLELERVLLTTCKSENSSSSVQFTGLTYIPHSSELVVALSNGCVQRCSMMKHLSK